MRDMNKPEPKGEMKVRRFRTIVLVAGLVLCAVSAQAESWREFQITDTPELWETRCDVSGNIVVWSIVGDVLAADITDPNEPEIFVVAGSEYSEGSPMISGRNVVWRRSVGRNGNIIAGTIRDITPGRGGPTKTVDSFAVTTDSTIDDAYPDIDDEWVVWTQDRPDVYGYDIACARLSDGRVASTYVVAMTGDLVFAPRISGALIVWSEDNSNDALGANISDPQNPLPFEVGLPTETCGGRELAVCIDGPWAL